jgi:hypothetical protein
MLVTPDDGIWGEVYSTTRARMHYRDRLAFGKMQRIYAKAGNNMWHGQDGAAQTHQYNITFWLGTRLYLVSGAKDVTMLTASGHVLVYLD